MKQFQKFLSSIEKLANEVYSTLGDGFSEDIYQRALAFEFRSRGIDYLRETNVEIFYKDQMVGLGEIDLYFPAQKNKYFSLTKPIILETKYLAKLNDSARSQLRQYLMSTRKNKTKAINKLEYGLLLNWQKEAEYDDLRIAPDKPIEIELWRYTEKTNLYKKIYEN